MATAYANCIREMTATLTGRPWHIRLHGTPVGF